MAYKHFCSLSTWLSFGCVFASATMIWFVVVPVAAQDATIQDIDESNVEIRLGYYLSLKGVAVSATGPLFIKEAIEFPEDDVMPYPSSFYSIRYKNYESIIGWENDAYGRYFNDHNENLFKFVLRYNKRGAKHMYMFTGPVIWYFNKSHNHTKYICDEYEDEYAGYSFPSAVCKEGASREVKIKTDRPDGISIYFGALLGLGVEYKLFRFLVFSHELEFFFFTLSIQRFYMRGRGYQIIRSAPGILAWAKRRPMFVGRCKFSNCPTHGACVL